MNVKSPPNVCIERGSSLAASSGQTPFNSIPGQGLDYLLLAVAPIAFRGYVFGDLGREKYRLKPPQDLNLDIKQPKTIPGHMLSFPKNR